MPPALARLSRTTARLLFLALLLFAGVSCENTEGPIEPTPTGTLAPTATDTAAPSATASATAAPFKTSTALPTATATNTPPPTASPSPSRTIPPTAAVTNTPPPMMRIPILMYHYISVPPPDADAVRRDLSVPPDVFRSQMAFLAAAGFHTIHLADLVRSFKSREALPAKPIILTFDDGYDDNYLNAFPALKELGFTATFFVITGRADSNSAGYMTWQQIQELASAGMEIGNHSVDHYYSLGQVPRAVQWGEIKPAFDDLRLHLSGQVPVFAYPSGSYNATTVSLLAELGYLAAVTTEQSTWEYETRPLELRRIRIRGAWSLDDFVSAMQYWTQGMY